jgi:hypothetical protein
MLDTMYTHLYDIQLKWQMKIAAQYSCGYRLLLFQYISLIIGQCH